MDPRVILIGTSQETRKVVKKGACFKNIKVGKTGQWVWALTAKSGSHFILGTVIVEHAHHGTCTHTHTNKC